MASADIQLQPTAPHTFNDKANSSYTKAGSTSKDVQTELNYYHDTGAPPEPAIVGKPESYNRPVDTHKVTVRDVRGREGDYGLDTTGFQYVRHESVEKTFDDEDRIKDAYYAEVEQVLKNTYELALPCLCRET